jgi:BirA family biotin operon repressor/biotin-[acetyl-CoA-carboxylase] ligase
VRVLAALADRYDGWAAAGGDPRAGTAADYLRACDTVGREVEVHLPDGSALRGTAVGVDDDGALLVRGDGPERALSAGDVVHVRPRS